VCHCSGYCQTIRKGSWVCYYQRWSRAKLIAGLGSNTLLVGVYVGRCGQLTTIKQVKHLLLLGSEPVYHFARELFELGGRAFVTIVTVAVDLGLHCEKVFSTEL